MRKLLSRVEGTRTICFRHAGGLVKQSKNSLPRLVDLVDTVRSRAARSRCKRNDRLSVVLATLLTTHFALRFYDFPR